MIKVNKIAIRIAHFFGRRLKEEHIDDVTINISSDNFTEEEMELIQRLGSKKTVPEEVCDKLRNLTYKALEADVRLRKKCANVCQIHMTFYKSLSDTRGGSIVRMCMYHDNALYLDISEVDRETWKRTEKLKELL